MVNLIIIYDVVNIFSMKSSRKLRVGLNWYPGVNWSTTTIKNYKYLRKMRVGVNRHTGVNWPTTTTLKLISSTKSEQSDKEKEKTYL